MLPWGRRCSGCFLFLLHLLVMVLVLRRALGRLSGLRLWPTCFSCRGRRALRLSRWWSLRRRGGGLRALLCHYRQRQRKHDERP